MTSPIDTNDCRKTCELVDPYFSTQARDLVPRMIDEIERLRAENEQQASQLLDPNATCCADATRRTKELREAHAAEVVHHKSEIARVQLQRDQAQAELAERRAADPVARIAANNDGQLHTCFLTGQEMEALKLARTAMYIGSTTAGMPEVASEYARALAVLDKILGGDRG